MNDFLYLSRQGVPKTSVMVFLIKSDQLRIYFLDFSKYLSLSRSVEWNEWSDVMNGMGSMPLDGMKSYPNAMCFFRFNNEI